MTKVINLYGGPGTGKSTTAAHLFALLKQDGHNCELVTEYAKDRVWEGSFNVLANQLYIFGKQYHRMFRLLGKVDYIITDSPLLFSLYYGNRGPDSFRQLVLDTYRSMNNIDIFLIRKKAYNPSGRMQTEQQAKNVDNELLNILADNQIKFITLDATNNAAHTIMESLKVL